MTCLWQPINVDALKYARGRICCQNSRLIKSPHLHKNREIHVILDNYCTHKKNEEWLQKHPNVYFHFTQTSASWLNQIEIWFGIFTRKILRGTGFENTAKLRDAIESYIKYYNKSPKPFVWKNFRPDRLAAWSCGQISLGSGEMNVESWPLNPSGLFPLAWDTPKSHRKCDVLWTAPWHADHL